jgi:hypothetical protein
VKDAQLRKALLLTRIEAHRQILRLELRCARATLDPWRLVLPRVVGALVGVVDRFVTGEPAARGAGGADAPGGEAPASGAGGAVGGRA